MRRITKVMPLRRRKEAKTNYTKRFAMVKSGLDRIVVRRSNTRIIGQAAGYLEKGDAILVYADSKELAKYKWPARPNRPTAYLVGLLLARKVKADQALASAEFILDIGLASPVKGSIPFVFAKGCIDGGIKMRSGMELSESIYNCSDVKYMKELKEKSPEKYNRQYSQYIREGIDAGKLGLLFSQAKERILHEQ
ncbi:MAG: 50S ribosomal protein L18 [Candidatus Marsarchaeota archaeon]|jgi:Ribosomal protein L18|nr:50S ribosomal protein L18 [Candidatus Marsarchaeota archaeon]MCL5419306.1 50S ribosomal protein L18 [Candidatus Marsarchaeota archaeon]